MVNDLATTAEGARDNTMTSFATIAGNMIRDGQLREIEDKVEERLVAAAIDSGLDERKAKIRSRIRSRLARSRRHRAAKKCSARTRTAPTAARRRTARSGSPT
jgi:hypothetical protein